MVKGNATWVDTVLPVAWADTIDKPLTSELLQAATCAL